MRNPLNNYKRILLISGNCGSGKTHGYMREIGQRWRQERFIIAAPTEDLVKQIERNLRSQYGVDGVTRLLSSDGIKVGEEFIRLLPPMVQCNVIVVTHKALENLGKELLLKPILQGYLTEFVVFLDEVPPAFLRASVKTNALRNHLWLSFMKSKERSAGQGGEYLLVNERERLLSFHSENHNTDERAKNAIWASLAGYPLIKSREDSNNFTITAYCHNPVLEVLKYAREFYLVSSNAQQAPLVVVAKQWLDINSEMAAGHLQPDRERNKHDSTRIICHAIFEQRASLSNLSKGDIYVHACRFARWILKKDFMYATNINKNAGGIKCDFASIADELFNGVGVRVPFVSHGLNIYGGNDMHGYSDEDLKLLGIEDAELYQNGFSKALWLGVARLDNETITHLTEVCEWLDCESGVLLEAVEKFSSFEPAYQMMLRSTLRDPNNSSQVEFFFIDEATMNYFREVYAPESKLGYVGHLDIPSKGKTTAARVRECKAKGLTVEETMEATGLGRATVYKHRKQRAG